MESRVDISTHQINDSGLKIFSIEDLQSAAEKSVQFSKVVKMGMSFYSRRFFFPVAQKQGKFEISANFSFLARDIDVGVEFNLGL